MYVYIYMYTCIYVNTYIRIYVSMYMEMYMEMSMENISGQTKKICASCCALRIFKDVQMLKIMLDPCGFLVFSDPPGLGLQERQLLLVPRFQWLLMAIKISIASWSFISFEAIRTMVEIL